MENFSRLLNQYIQRVGINDTELARAIGVSRQTIFRWREGSTARPRHRDDVLAIAKKLRLNPDERDTLLLAAGFRPEQPTLEPPDPTQNSKIETSDNLQPKIQPEPPTRTALSSRGKPGWGWGVLAGFVIFLLVAASMVWWFNTKFPSDNQIRPMLVPAAENETLIVVTHFANYASSQVGYNVAGRLTDALQQEVENTGLKNIRVDIWPEVVDRRDSALQLGNSVKATLVVFGEYDVGRVVVQMVHPADRNLFIDPALQRHVADLQDLSATINSDLPQQVRSLALMALGQIYLGRGDTEQAQPLLAQARDYLQNDPTVDKKTWGLINFYLGIAYQHSHPPNLDGAIEAYTQSIEAWPGMMSSRLNRGAAYEARKNPGDLQQALQDAEAVVAAAPEWASGYNNRASIRLNIGGDENLILALADLEKALELNPGLPEVYVNQAIIHLRQGSTMRDVTPVVENALALRPNYGTALNVLCWGYAVEQQPDVALPYCNQAVKAEPTTATFQDSRGLAYALLGNYPAAITDFNAYANWLANRQSGPAWEKELTRRQAWIDALKQEESPFTPELLAELRLDFGE